MIPFRRLAITSFLGKVDKGETNLRFEIVFGFVVFDFLNVFG